MRQFALLFGIWFTLAACASGQKINDYKFTYRFSTGQSSGSSKLDLDMVNTEVKTLDMESLEPSWYNINSKLKLTYIEIEQIKKCVAFDKKDVTKCKKKNVYYVTIEI
jgi:hypothetical protein